VQRAGSPCLYTRVVGKARNRARHIMLYMVSSRCRPGFGMLIHFSRAETAFHALYRGPRGPSSEPGEGSVEAIADISSDTVTVPPSIDPPRVGVPLTQPTEPRRRHRGSAAPAAEDGVRRSARLAQVSAPLRRSTRFRQSEM
jgi:hypothetical protein